jgi:hypothetical protein
MRKIIFLPGTLSSTYKKYVNIPDRMWVFIIVDIESNISQIKFILYNSTACFPSPTTLFVVPSLQGFLQNFMHEYLVEISRSVLLVFFLRQKKKKKKKVEPLAVLS